MAESYGKQLFISKNMMEQFWDHAKYEQMTEIGKHSYLVFQFELCCGRGFALLNDGKVEENLTGYEVVDIEAMEVKESEEENDYRIQKLNGEYLLLQQVHLDLEQNFVLFSVRNISEKFEQLKNLATWFVSIYVEFPMDIENYSDKPVFLLPFEEIKNIFENTMMQLFSGVKMGKEYGYVNLDKDGNLKRQYPSDVYTDIEININEIKLGYMQTNISDDIKESLLIPVWDFIGTWRAEKITAEGIVSEEMQEEKVSLLTINASDGTIIQRMY